MSKHLDVLGYLRPNGGYVAIGDKFEGIEFIDCEPFTKDQYDKASKEFDDLQLEKENEKKIARQNAEAKLLALGLTLDDLKALGL